jgi:hypothetical protein
VDFAQLPRQVSKLGAPSAARGTGGGSVKSIEKLDFRRTAQSKCDGCGKTDGTGGDRAVAGVSGEMRAKNHIFCGMHYLHQEEWHMSGFAKILLKDGSVSCNEQAPLPALAP